MHKLFGTIPTGIKGFMPDATTLKNYKKTGYLNINKMFEDRVLEEQKDGVTIHKNKMINFDYGETFFEFA